MEYISTAIRNKTGILTLNRPDKRNALHPTMVMEITETIIAWQKIKDVKVILIEARGKAFSAGADLAYLQSMQDFTYAENLEDSRRLKDMFYAIYRSEKPVIAAVQGHAIAGGAGLVTVCDYVIASAEARLGFTEVRIGFIPALVSVFLKIKSGEGVARRLLLRGDLVTADDALHYGLFHEVVSDEEVSQRAYDVAYEMVNSNSSNSMMETKQLLISVESTDMEQALERAAEANAKSRSSEDCRQGLQAFLNKEKIRWV